MSVFIINVFFKTNFSTTFFMIQCNEHVEMNKFLMGKRELVALLNLSSWCLVMVEPLFLAVPRGFCGL